MDLSYFEYKAIVESSPNMIWRSGTDAKCDYFNETWLKFTGRTLEQELGSGWAEGVHPDDLDACLKTYLEAFEKREPFEMEYRLNRFDGQPRWISDRGVPFFDDGGKFCGYIGSCVDVTERVEGRKLTEMAHYDKTTGIYNRNYLDYRLDYEFEKALHGKPRLAVFMMDIDRFKLINDFYGHDAGDRVLAHIARKLSGAVRKSDIVGRYGGDEFLAVLPNTGLDEARPIADRILASLSAFKIGEASVNLSLSIGIAALENDAGVSELIKRADTAMYRAKKEGGGRYKASGER